MLLPLRPFERDRLAELVRRRMARLAEERRLQAWGLLALALLTITFSILRNDSHRIFTPGWWRLW